MYVLRRTVNIVNSTVLFNCYIGLNSCSDWRLEEPRIHDPDTKTVRLSPVLVRLQLCLLVSKDVGVHLQLCLLISKDVGVTSDQGKM